MTYIKKRNCFCIIYNTPLSFSAVSSFLKKSHPVEYRVLKKLKNDTFRHWYGIAEAKIRAYASTFPIEDIRTECTIAVLQAVDTMLFPNQQNFTGRIAAVIKKNARLLSQKQTETGIYDSEEDSLSAIAKIADEKTPDPLSLITEQEKFSLTEVKKKFLEWGFEEEAIYIDKFSGASKGRISQYEARKLKGSVRFLLLSFFGGRM